MQTLKKKAVTGSAGGRGKMEREVLLGLETQGEYVRFYVGKKIAGGYEPRSFFVLKSQFEELVGLDLESFFEEFNEKFFMRYITVDSVTGKISFSDK